MTALQIFYVRKFLPIVRYLLENIIFLIFGLGMFWLVCFVKGKISESIASLIVLFIIGVVVYAIFCFMYTIISKRKMIVELREMCTTKVLDR